MRLRASIVLLSGIAFTACFSTPAQKEAKFLKTGSDYFDKKDYARAALEFMNAVRAAHTAEPLYRLGLTYLQLQDYDKAVLCFQQALQLNPQHSGAQLKLAEMMASTADKNTLEDAKKWLDAIIGASPDNAEAINALSITEARLGNPDEAIRTLEQALRKAPADLRTSISLARLKLSQKDVDGAERALKDAVQHAPNSVHAALALSQFRASIGKLDEAEAEAHRAVSLDPKNGTALLTLAYVQANQNRLDQAEETYRRISALPEKQYKPLHAIFLLRTGKTDGGIAELQRLWKADRKDRNVRTRLVAAYVTANKQDDAEKLLSEAIQAQPNDSLALSQRAEIYLWEGKYAQAEKDLQQAAGAQLESAPVHYALARIRAASGAKVGQRQELEEALRLDPNMLAARMDLVQALIADKQAQTALNIVNQAPAAQKNNPGLIAVYAAALMGAGDRSAAAKEIQRGLAIARTPLLLIQGATLKTIQKNYAGARVPLEELLKRQPDNIDGWNLLVETYAAEKQLPKAVARLRKGVQQNPRSAKLQFLYGLNLVAAGDLKGARSALAAAAAIEPNLADLQPAQVQLEIVDGKTAAAKQMLMDAIAQNPKNTTARLMFAELENKAGNPGGANAQYRAIIGADPNNVTALNNLAWLFAKDNPEEALKYAQQAAKLAPEDPSVQDTIGWLYYHKGVYDSAVRYLKAAVAIEGTPRRKYHLGLALTKGGDQDAGRKMVRAALDSDPSLAKTEGN
ncbi:MAG: tetratricopeptide repeat protein [Bryobacterales bacterium]|nr:tetratricopeptide repeat protein [Bryobacterales bacterium]